MNTSQHDGQLDLQPVSTRSARKRLTLARVLSYKFRQAQPDSGVTARKGQFPRAVR